MKQHTIIFVPHARAKFRKIRISSLQLALVAAAIVVVTLVSAVSTTLYVTSTIDHEHLTRIEQENDALKAVNARFTSSIQDLESQLSDYQQRIHKLAIVAGLAELSPEGEVGIGGLAPAEAPDLRNWRAPSANGAASRTVEVADRELPRTAAHGAAHPTGEIRNLNLRLSQLDSSMEAIATKLGENHLLIASTPAVAPTKGLMTSGFGYRRDPFTKRRAFHNGLDIVAPRGTPIHASGDGIVIRAGRVGALGKAVYLSHGFDVTTRYGHMSKIAVEPGDQVRRGDVIGYVGSTGRSTGNHLHYEVRIGGKPVDPRGYILDGRR
ncbi:MAG: M23 family metallopeptidase [Acidobacteriota bacterium]